MKLLLAFIWNVAIMIVICIVCHSCYTTGGVFNIILGGIMALVLVIQMVKINDLLS